MSVETGRQPTQSAAVDERGVCKERPGSFWCDVGSALKGGSMGTGSNGGEMPPLDDKDKEGGTSGDNNKEPAGVTSKAAFSFSFATASETAGPSGSVDKGGDKLPSDGEGAKVPPSGGNGKQPPVTPGVLTAAGAPGTQPSKLTVLTNIADKLTDVLNLGRVLSIGVPGCVAAFGIMLLVARFTTRVEIPAKTVVGAGRVTPDQVRAVPDAAFMPELGPASVLNTPDCLLAKAETRLNLRVRVLRLRDSLWAASQPTVCYDQLDLRNAPTAVQFQMAKLRVAQDIETVRDEKHWFVWLVLIVLLGCTITVWGYWHLLRRKRLRDTWQYLVEEVLPGLKLDGGTGSTTTMTKAEKKARSRPTSWGALDGLIKTLEKKCDKDETAKDKLKEAKRRALAGREGMPDIKCSWTNLHTPLMTGAQTGLEGMSLLDYLIKEYWRFVEFSVNLPIAVLVCLLLLGLYWFSLLPQCPLGQLGIVVSLLALMLFWDLRYWTDRVSLNQLDKYHVAVNGTVAGLMLVVRKDDRCLLDSFEDTTLIGKKYLDRFKDSLG